MARARSFDLETRGDHPTNALFPMSGAIDLVGMIGTIDASPRK